MNVNKMECNNVKIPCELCLKAKPVRFPINQNKSNKHFRVVMH